MAIYNTGTTGKIHIEDTGSWIHIYLEAGQPATNVGTLGFSWSDPLGSGSGSISYPAGSGKKLAKSLGPFGAGQGGTVWFTMNATGTQGFGGPTTVSFGFSRSTVPPAPSAGAIKEITHQSFRTSFNWAGDGGSPVDTYEVHYSNNPSGGQFSLQTGDGSQLINVSPPNFPPGSPIYYWVRAHNAVGWGPFAGPVGATLLPGIRIKVGGDWKYAVPYVKVAGVWKAAIVYVKSAGAWKESKL